VSVVASAMITIVAVAILATLDAAPAPAPAEDLSAGHHGNEPLVIPPLPAGFSVDGDLSEWVGPPHLRLGPGAQVAGKRKLRDDADFSADIWLAVGPEGLALAADVRDDVVRFPRTANEEVTADHLELWMALPPASFPPVAFANQFGEQQCESTGAGQEAGTDGCRPWQKAQEKLRQALSRLFVRQFLLSPRGVTEAFASAIPEVAKLSPPCCSAARVAVREVPGGWRLEAFIPLGLFPATGRSSLDGLRLMVDAADADGMGDRLEAFVTSAPNRAFGKPETFLAARLEQPIHFDCEAPGIEARFGGRGNASDASPTHWAVFPGVEPREALVFENIRVGYQYQPTEPSPAVTRVPLAARTLASFADLRVVDAAIGGRVVAGLEGPLHGLVILRGDEVVSVQPLWQSKARAAVSDGIKARVGVVREGTLSIHGSGACGASHILEVTVLELAPGSSKPLFTQWLGDCGTLKFGGKDQYLTDFRAEVAPGLDEVRLTGQMHSEDGGGDAAQFSWLWRWQSAEHRYAPANSGAIELERIRSAAR
jgi:hypothetical protein